ncbi:RICIN domain-containing protein [Streptomyces shenzhenensis]|uniref:RICIN domain-containing protein n=1 Tax=Streptomyces shenzhenensis TaxID=943815 RepID=UPI0038241BFF
MLTPRPPRPPYPPPGAAPGESDESLAAPLRAGSDAEAARSAGLLMARHWQPAQDYAAICLATPGSLAHLVTAAAFHQVLDLVALGESADALRPRLLVAVRDMVENWSADAGMTEVMPGLGKPAGGRGMRAAKSLTPENRALAERAYEGLPPLDRSLLWHTEVEAESINVPAGLLGMDADSAAVALEHAREKFREGCVSAHRELAPSKDCRFYNRLLDVPIRRGGALLPDVRRHLAECRHCRHAAEQLGHVEAGLGLLLAEAVLGWGARRYVDSRPGRTRPAGPRARGTARHGGGRPGGGGRHRLLDRIPAPARRAARAAGRSPRTLLIGVGVAGVGLLATVLAVSAWPEGGDGSDPVSSTSVSGGRGTLPGSDAVSPPASSAPVRPGALGQTRLRNAAADLCLDIKGRPRAGAGIVLAACSPAWSQQWTYENDGLLRNAADAELCLDSHADAGVVILGACAPATGTRGTDVRYDLTVQGELLPRWDETLALAPSADGSVADVVVRARDGSDGQRWLTDPPPATPGSLSITGTGTPTAQPARLPARD